MDGHNPADQLRDSNVHSHPDSSTDCRNTEHITRTDRQHPTSHRQAGETFDIVLSSNPSTGYHWEVIPELDENIVQFAAQNYLAEEPVMPGSGGVDVWTFRAVNAGDTTIVLGYYPPGNDTDPDETLTFSIHVE